jgi:hypothetical protein
MATAEHSAGVLPPAALSASRSFATFSRDTRSHTKANGRNSAWRSKPQHLGDFAGMLLGKQRVDDSRRTNIAATSFRTVSVRGQKPFRQEACKSLKLAEREGFEPSKGF